MLGGLHIELCFLNVLGKRLTESGWAEMIINADSFLKGKHVTRTRRAHQVTAACLHTLVTNAYKADTEDSTLENIECPSFIEWREKQKSKRAKALSFCTGLECLIYSCVFYDSSDHLEKETSSCTLNQSRKCCHRYLLLTTRIMLDGSPCI